MAKAKKKTAPKAKKASTTVKAKIASRGWPQITDPVTKRRQSLYCATYKHAGATWGLDFWADDAKDAAAKLKSIRASLTMDGVVQGARK